MPIHWSLLFEWQQIQMLFEVILKGCADGILIIGIEIFVTKNGPLPLDFQAVC